MMVIEPLHSNNSIPVLGSDIEHNCDKIRRKRTVEEGGSGCTELYTAKYTKVSKASPEK